MKIISLNGIWELRRFDGQRGHRGQTVAGSPSLGGHSFPAEVPGTVHDTLVKHEIISDPAIGLNALSARWVEHFLWTYRRKFEVPRLASAQRAWLRCECLDLAAQVFINGKLVGQHANRFRPGIFEVTDNLQPGGNTVVIEVESGLFQTMNRSAADLGCRIDSEQGKRPWLRTIQSAFGWDWGEHLLPVGITGDVSLIVAETVHVIQTSCLATLGDDLTTGRITVRSWLEIWSEPTEQIILRMVLKQDGREVLSQAVASPGVQRVEASLEVKNPALWWPRGVGAQPRYEVLVEVRVGSRIVSTETRLVGFRHIRINQSQHPKEGRFFIVEVNGRPVFMKGSNLVPIDVLPSRFTSERYERLVAEALVANFNTLRVWGGGVYESDTFYEACDREGIIVWQEFIYACAKYPMQDATLLAEAKAEAEYQVRRLNHHPSLVIWCGNNEMEWGMAAWNYDKAMAFPDHALFHFVLPRILREEDGSRPYQPSSPYSPDLDFPNADHTGDQHPWSIGFGDTDFRKYRAMTCRFPNEGGFLGSTALSTVRACLPEGQRHVRSFAWDQKDNAVSFWVGIEGGGDWLTPFSPDRMIEDWLGREVTSLSLAEYVYCSGIIHGEALSEYIRNFRRRMFDSAAAIFWMFNDAWPMVRSWTIIDYFLRRTPAFHPVRRAFAPIAVIVVRNEASIQIFGVNDGLETLGLLDYGLFSLNGNYPLRENKTVTLRTNASTLLAEFPSATWDAVGVTSHVAFAVLFQDKKVIARDRLILPLFKEMAWPVAHIQVARHGDEVEFSSKEFVWRVCLDLEGSPELGDNFFDLFPGQAMRLAWRSDSPDPEIRGLGNNLFRT